MLIGITLDIGSRGPQFKSQGGRKNFLLSVWVAISWLAFVRHPCPRHPWYPNILLHKNSIPNTSCRSSFTFLYIPLLQRHQVVSLYQSNSFYLWNNSWLGRVIDSLINSPSIRFNNLIAGHNTNWTEKYHLWFKKASFLDGVINMLDQMSSLVQKNCFRCCEYASSNLLSDSTKNVFVRQHT